MERVEQVVRLHLTPSRLHTEPLINQMKAWEAGAARHADCLWEPVPRGRTDKWWFHVQVLMRSLTCEMINSNVIFTEKTESTHEGNRLEKTVCLVGKFLFLCPSLVIRRFKNWTRIYIYSKNIFIYMLHIFKDVVVECYRSATKSVHSAAIWQLYGSIRYRITRLQSSFVPLRLRDSWTVEDLIKRKKTLTREHRDASLENRRRRHTTQVILKLR